MIYGYTIVMKNNMDVYSIFEFEFFWSMWSDVHNRYTLWIIIQIRDWVAARMVNCSELKQERKIRPIVSVHQTRRTQMSEDDEHTLLK